MPATTTAKDHLDVLRKSLKKSTPYTSGVLQVRSEDLVLFHTSGDGEREANYRKAGNLDCTEFAASLDIGTLQILDAISPDLLDGQKDSENKMIRAELYKLNVYGPGSFFKEHKDTPRGEDMVGSLVIVFPTVHQGGGVLSR
ncbi:hypothetical protein C8F01DRAFT_1077833 [Mycena amicta]|nr:hypothetical protein C8F01DRAFT_1077833 [Mycena amicta]